MAEMDGKNEIPETTTKKKATKAAKPPAARARKPAATKKVALVDAPARQGDSSIRVTFAAADASKKAPASKVRMNPEERKRLISERAYSKAVRRGFKAGNPRMDWLEAEREIDSELVGDALSRG